MGNIRYPRTSQPQGSVGIDWGNPLAKGLAFAANGATGVDAVSGAIAVLTGSSSRGLSKGGVSHKSPTTQVPGAFTYTVNIPSSFDITVLVLNRNITAQAANNGIQTLHFNSAEPVLFSTTGSQTLFSTTNNSSTTITTLTAGNVYALAGVKRVNSQYQWVNGVQLTNDVTGNRAVGAITTVSVGRPAGGNNIENSEYYTVLYWNRALSDAEIKTLSDNPWRIFNPVSRNLWIPASAGGGATYTLTADAGSYALTGADAGLTFNRVLTAAAGSYSLSGADAGLTFNRVLSAGAASYALTGADATLTYTPIGGPTYTLTADAASYTLTGADANLAFNRVLGAAAASYNLTGANATLAFNRVLSAAAGSYSLTGADASFVYNRVLTVDQGSYSLTGSDATLTYAGATATVGRPASDTSNAGWLPSTGSDLYAMVDEVTPDSADYVYATTVGAICQMALNTTAYPGASSQVLKFRGSSSTGNSVIVRLKNTGGSTVRSETQALTGTDTEYTVTLTSGEIAAITSGSMSVELESA